MRHRITPVLWPTGSRFLWVGVRPANHKGSKAWTEPTSICQMATRLQENTKERIRGRMYPIRTRNWLGQMSRLQAAAWGNNAFWGVGSGSDSCRYDLDQLQPPQHLRHYTGDCKGHGYYPKPTPTTHCWAYPVLWVDTPCRLTKCRPEWHGLNKLMSGPNRIWT